MPIPRQDAAQGTLGGQEQVNKGDKVRFRMRTQPSPQPMVVAEVIGKDHVTLDDGKVWPTSALVLDIYWKGNLPQIEKGVPIPPINRTDRRKTGQRTRPESKWPDFIRSLEVGDSFVLKYPEAATVKAHARTLGIKLHWVVQKERGPWGRCVERFWRI